MHENSHFLELENKIKFAIEDSDQKIIDYLDEKLFLELSVLA